MPKPVSFSCTSYTADWSTGVLTFSYETHLEDGVTHTFTETLHVPLPSDLQRTTQPAVERMCEMIHLTLGVSYFKVFGPTVITHPYVFTQEQTDYWKLLYTHGLGEYYYTNSLDFRDVQIEGVIGDGEVTPVELSERSLILHGGGKDSIVSVEIAKKADMDFDLFAVNHSGIQEAVAEVIGKPIHTIKRQVDMHMVELSKSGTVYNGHVPISAVYASLAMLYAVLHDYAHIIVSNEESAVYGNVDYLGIHVNHQWSKSQAFESATRGYLASICGTSLQFFSLLRPLYEIRIAQLFATFPQYFEHFSSSNHNFTLSHDGKKKRWDVDFSKGKVEFVWALLSAFLSKQDMLRIFEEDIFSREDRLHVFKQLLGEEDIKPLDCVGTPEETIYALYLCYQRGEWNDAPIMTYFVNDVLPKHVAQMDEYKSLVMGYGDDSHIPDTFRRALKSMLETL